MYLRPVQDTSPPVIQADPTSEMSASNTADMLSVQNQVELPTIATAQVNTIIFPDAINQDGVLSKLTHHDERGLGQSSVQGTQTGVSRNASPRHAVNVSNVQREASML